MTRMTIPALISDFNAKYADNTSGLITPVLAREAFQNQMDSAVPFIAYTAGTSGPGVAIPLTTTPIKIPATFFTQALSGIPAFMEGRPNPNGDILVKTAIGRLWANFDVTFTTAAGTDIVFSIGKNGTPLLFRAIASGQAAGNPVSTAFTWLFDALAVNDTFDIRVAALTGTPTITLFGAAIKGIMLPQFQP